MMATEGNSRYVTLTRLRCLKEGILVLALIGFTYLFFFEYQPLEAIEWNMVFFGALTLFLVVQLRSELFYWRGTRHRIPKRGFAWKPRLLILLFVGILWFFSAVRFEHGEQLDFLVAFDPEYSPYAILIAMAFTSNQSCFLISKKSIKYLPSISFSDDIRVTIKWTAIQNVTYEEGMITLEADNQSLCINLEEFGTASRPMLIHEIQARSGFVPAASVHAQ